MAGVVVRTQDCPQETWAALALGNAAWRTLISGDVTLSRSMSAGVLEMSGEGSGLKPHRHAQAEIYYVAEGDGVLTVDGVESLVSAGSAAFIPGEAEHGIRNAGGAVLRIFYVFPADRFSEVVYRISGDGTQ